MAQSAYSRLSGASLDADKYCAESERFLDDEPQTFVDKAKGWFSRAYVVLLHIAIVALVAAQVIRLPLKSDMSPRGVSWCE